VHLHQWVGGPADDSDCSLYGQRRHV